MSAPMQSKAGLLLPWYEAYIQQFSMFWPYMYIQLKHFWIRQFKRISYKEHGPLNITFGYDMHIRLLHIRLY